MKKKIAAGTFLVLAIALALALGFAQLYRGASEAAKVECEGGGGEAISPNETEDENITPDQEAYCSSKPHTRGSE